MGVLAEQAEGITIEELEYRLLASGTTPDDFNQQMTKMLGRAVDFQRKRADAAAAAVRR